MSDESVESTNSGSGRLNAGIDGLNKMLLGGFLPARNILLCGPSGSGKSTFGMHFIHRGALEKQHSLYITLEESKAKLYEDMAKFGLDLKALEKDGYFTFIGGPLADVSDYMQKVDATTDHLIMEIQEIVKKYKTKRVVIDSLNLFSMLGLTLAARRSAIAKLCNVLSSCGAASLLLSEMPEGTHVLSKDGIEEFIVDGVVVLYHFKEGSKFVQGIGIRKMRGTNHEREIRPYAITDEGVVVYPDEPLFAEF